MARTPEHRSPSRTPPELRRSAVQWRVLGFVWGLIVLGLAAFLLRSPRRIESGLLVARGTRIPTATTTSPTVTSLPSPGATLPTPTLTPTVLPYALTSYDGDAGLGISKLFIASVTLGGAPPLVDRADLRIPTSNLRPSTGRYAELRGPYRLTHLGSDYLDPGQAPMIPPSDTAILAAAVHLKRNTYTAIAVDMSGDIQMYLVMLDTDEGPHPYLFCFAHLLDGGNVQALEQAQENQGRVAVMGTVSPVGGGDANLSDIHIGVIDVMALLEFTGESDLPGALPLLFSAKLARDNQQYPSIFVEPESVYPALADLLARTMP